MAIAYRSHAATSGTDATAEGSLPAGVTQDDYLIAFFMHSSLGADVATAPSGWTDIGADPPTGDFSLKAYGRVYQTSDSPPTLEWDVAGNWAVDIVAYSGVDTTTPISDSGSGVSSGTVTSLDIGPVTPGVNDCLLVAFCNADLVGTPRTFSSPTMTARVNEATNEHNHGVLDEQLTGGSGTPVTRTLTISDTGSQHLAGYIYALAPAAAGGVDAEVLAVAATATAAPVVPQNVKGAARVTLTAAISVTAATTAPGVAGGARVAGVTASINVTAPAPGATGGAQVAAEAPTASVVALAPTVTAESSGVTVSAVTAEITVAAHAPAYSIDSSVTATLATATVTVQTPAVTGVIVLHFTPPTYERPIRSAVRPLNYYRQTFAQSVVRVNGSFRLVSQPTADLLTAAGEPGVDYFIGGHIYVVTEETAAELTAAGYSLNLPSPQPAPPLTPSPALLPSTTLLPRGA